MHLVPARFVFSSSGASHSSNSAVPLQGNSPKAQLCAEVGVSDSKSDEESDGGSRFSEYDDSELSNSEEEEELWEEMDVPSVPMDDNSTVDISGKQAEICRGSSQEGPDAALTGGKAVVCGAGDASSCAAAVGGGDLEDPVAAVVALAGVRSNILQSRLASVMIWMKACICSALTSTHEFHMR